MAAAFGIRPRRRLSLGTVVWMLGATQIIGYGTVYYSFAILAGDIAAELGWPVAWVFGAFSLAILCGGLLAPWAGRQVDRHGAPALMAAGSLAAAAALAFTAMVPGKAAFVSGLVAVELASAFILYDAAFAALVQIGGPNARRRIIHLTLIAGFASTLFWPLTSWLNGFASWREVLLVFAGLNLFVCLPLHLLIAASPPAPAAPEPGGPEATLSDPPLPAAVRRRAFVLVTAGFALSGFLLSAIIAQMVPLLTALGLGASALVVATLFGPAQVLVRFVNMIFGVRRHPVVVTIAAMAMLPLAVAILSASAPLTVGAAVFAVLLGFGAGMKSIVQGTLPLALFGGEAYGQRLGRMALARQFLAAMAPFALAWLMERFGPAVALAVLVGVGLLGLAAFVEVARLHRSGAEAVAVETA